MGAPSRLATASPACAEEARAAAELVRVRIADLHDPRSVAAERAARGGVENPTLCVPVRGPVGGRGLDEDGVRPGAAQASGEAAHRGEALAALGTHGHATACESAHHREWSSRTQRMEGATQVAGIAPDGCMLPDGCVRFVAQSGGGWGIVRGALTVPGSVMLFVAPRGCGRHGSVASLLNGYRHRVFYLDVPEEDFVMGGHVDRAEQMVDRILAVLPQQDHPRAFFICSTCVDALLGSDFDGVCDILAARHGIPFSRCHMNPITRNSSTPPALNLQRSIYRLLWQETLYGRPAAHPPRDAHAVNLVGGFVPVDAESELYGVLAKAGFEVRQLPACATFDDFLAMRSSGLNVMLKPHASLACKDMRDRLDIPFAQVRNGFSLEAARAAYDVLSDALGAPLDTSDAEERAREALCDARGWLAGLSVAVGANLNGSSFEMALFLARLGARIAFVISDAIAPSEWPSVVALRELQPDVAVYPETHPGASRYCTVPEHADVAIGFDAAQLAPDAKFLEFASDIEPFGYETPMRLLEGIKDALAGTEDARAALYSKGLVV